MTVSREVGETGLGYGVLISEHNNGPQSASTPAAPPRRPQSIRLPAPIPAPHRGWRRLPLTPRAKLAQLGLTLFLVALSLRLVILGRNALALRDLRSGSASTVATPASVSRPNLVVQLTVIAVGLLAAGAFIFWLHRVCRNWATQGKPRFSPNWAVLAWFVPPFALWRPAQIMVDLFADRPGMRKIDDADAWLIAVWWFAGLAGVFGRVGLRFWDVSSLADRLNWHYVALSLYTLLGLSAVAGLLLVSQLTARHDVGARS